ncbi:MAG: aldehyde dehydrogenase family protein [Microbacterium sp.]
MSTTLETGADSGAPGAAGADAIAAEIARMRSRHAAAAADVPYTHVSTLRIGGEDVAATGTATPVIDPATGEQWGSVPEGSAAEVDAAVRAARAAFPAWAARTPGDRADALRRMADAIERRAVPLALTNTLENGSPIAETSGAAANAAAILHVFAGLAGFLEEPDIRPFPGGVNETLVARDPVGVCALIAPWNFPINLVVIKLAPALLAGCTVVIKPASPTPLSVRFLLDAADEAGIPPGVINLVTGSAATGDALVRHPDVDKVAFTGSTPVGRKIAAACGELLRPVTLELGGKSAALVLPDADLDAMSAVLLRSCIRNTGQTCYISTRLIATPERYDELVDMVTTTVGAASVGDPLDPATVFGPVATAAQRDGVRALIRAGVAEGARVTLGGDVAAPFDVGSFVAPTVFADVRPDMRIAQEEIFGPVITILRADDVDDAVAIANGTRFGLGGIVFGADEDAALRVARRIDTGSIGINFFASNHLAPFGGRHDSGLGVEYGIEGLSAYLTPQSVHRRAR